MGNGTAPGSQLPAATAPATAPPEDTTSGSPDPADHGGATPRHPGAQPLTRGTDPAAVPVEGGSYYWWSTTGPPGLAPLPLPTSPMSWSWYGDPTAQAATSTPQLASQASAGHPHAPAAAPVLPEAPVAPQAAVAPEAPVVSSRFIPAQPRVTPGTVTVMPRHTPQPHQDTAPAMDTGLYRAVAAGTATAVVATTAVVIMMRRMILAPPRS